MAPAHTKTTTKAPATTAYAPPTPGPAPHHAVRVELRNTEAGLARLEQFCRRAGRLWHQGLLDLHSGERRFLLSHFPLP